MLASPVPVLGGCVWGAATGGAHGGVVECTAAVVVDWPPGADAKGSGD